MHERRPISELSFIHSLLRAVQLAFLSVEDSTAALNRHTAEREGPWTEHERAEEGAGESGEGVEGRIGLKRRSNAFICWWPV